MDLDTFRALLAPSGQQLLAEAEQLLAANTVALTALTRLRRTGTAALAAAAWEQATLRQQAQKSGKFTRAADLYFTRDGLEQATSAAVAQYRAQRFATYGPLADLACGIGGDSLVLAQQHPVVALDRDRLRLAILRENARIMGVTARLLPVCADLTAAALPRVAAAFCDPGRRTATGKRVFSTAQYQPPFAIIRQWQAVIPALAVKVSPGIVREEWPSPEQAELEFISVGGALKEAVIWFGPLRTVAQRATVLPAGATLTAAPHVAGQIPSAAPTAFLYEPDPAVIRSGLVETLAANIGATKLDPDIAYLTADHLVATPFAHAYQLVASLPFSMKRLVAWLRAHDAGEVTVKKRGSPLDTAQVAQRLRGTGGTPFIVVLTHVLGRPFVLICQPAAE